MKESQIISNVARLWYSGNCSFDKIVEAILNDDTQALHHIRETLLSVIRLLETHCLGERLSRYRLSNITKYNPDLNNELMKKLSEAGISKKTFYNLTADKQREIIGVELHRRLLNETKNIKMQDEETAG